jgi:hypothetical protein
VALSFCPTEMTKETDFPIGAVPCPLAVAATSTIVRA